MIYKVVFFTRTDHTKRIAEKIAKKLDSELIEIKDNKNWKGLFGFVKAGFFSSANIKVKIQLSQDLGDYDQLILVAPIWARGLAPAARTFIDAHLKDKIHLVVSSIESKVKQREGFLSVTDITERNDNEDMVIADFINHLKP